MLTRSAASLPVIIQGGMGVAVSGWQLARAVSAAGQLGVVSGTAIDTVLVRRLQMGDRGGHMRRALAEFPYPAMAERVLQRYFIAGGKAPDAPFALTSILPVEPAQEELELIVVANFVEVFLAKEGHDGPVGINYLEKIQTPTLPSLFGAMLAGVDYVLMGAGIPRLIPGVLDQLCEGRAVELPLVVAAAREEDHFVTRFDPMTFTRGEIPWLERPKFLPIVASATLASMLARKANGQVDGFVVEGPTAGGHNAPPRGQMQLNDRGEPLYGERDVVDLAAMRASLACRSGWRVRMAWQRVCAALDAGAAGVQVGTAFAFCDESGLPTDLKQRVLQMCRTGEIDVLTDAAASPTGFPFKVLQMPGSVAEAEVYEQRTRVCDLGFLRQAYRQADGEIGWRCPGEPLKSFVRKGGEIEDTVGRKCVCNGLISTIGLGQIRHGDWQEPPLVTCGNDVANVLRFLPHPDATGYAAADVIDHLLADIHADRAAVV